MPQALPKTVAFTSRYAGRSRVLINEVYVGRPQTASPIVKKPSDARKYLALWDTGATGTVITRAVVDDCGLKPIGLTKVHHAKGEDTSAVYLISIFLPNRVCFPSLRVTEGDLAGDIDVLIGMDVITQGDFAVTNLDGKTVFSFRIPSRQCVDFVKEANEEAAKPGQPVRLPPKIGRNVPCPCGSGKKYKYCCGK